MLARPHLRGLLRRAGFLATLFRVTSLCAQETPEAPEEDRGVPPPADHVESDSALEFTFAPRDLSLIDLMNRTVVSASATDESVARAPAVIDVITSEEIAASGYRTLAEALENRAGLDVLHDHFQSSLGVRGITGGVRGASRNVKVMVDGQPIAFRPSGENFIGLEAIPMMAVERVEIIRGPASVLYGANAFLGVINIITKQGYQIQGGAEQLGYEGGPHTQNPWGEVLVGTESESWSFVGAAAGESRRDENYSLVELPTFSTARSGEISEADSSMSGSAFARATWSSPQVGKLSLDAHFQQLERDAEFTDWGPMAHDNHLHLRNGFARLRYNVDWQEKLFAEVSLGVAAGGVGRKDHLNLAPSSSGYLERDLAHTGRDVSSHLRYELSDLSRITAGIDSTWDTQTPAAHYSIAADGQRSLNPPAGYQTDDIEFLNLGVYLNATVHPFERSSRSALKELGTSAGIRLDAHNVYGEAYSTRAGLVYTIQTRHYIKALYGSSFKAPASTQLFSNNLEPGGVIGNPDLQPEKARTFELALGSTLARGLTARVNGFYTQVIDRVEIREPAPESALPNERPVNGSPIDSLGGEAELNFKWRGLSVFANYSYQTSTYQEANFLSIDEEMVKIQTDAYPQHLIKGGLTSEHPELYLRGVLAGRWVGARPGTQTNNALVNGIEYLEERYALDPYALVDLTLSTMDLHPWGHRETRVTGRIRNLFNTNYTMPGYGGFDIPGLARTYEVALRQEF